jgi:hypothetical protein
MEDSENPPHLAINSDKFTPALLATVKGVGLYYAKPVWWVDIATAVFAISATALVSYLAFIATTKK